MQETPEERTQRKENFLNITVMRSAQGVDNIEEILQEASEKWEQENI